MSKNSSRAPRLSKKCAKGVFRNRFLTPTYISTRISPISPGIYLYARLRPTKTDLQSRTVTQHNGNEKIKGKRGRGKKEKKKRKKGTKEIRNGVTR